MTAAVSGVRKQRLYLLGFGALVVFDTLAQVCFKLAGEHALPLQADLAWLGRVAAHPWIYGALVGYLGAFVTWMTLLEHAPIGPAFAASHLEIVAVLAVSAVLFGERLAPLQIAGAVFIALGIVVLGISEVREAPAAGHTGIPPGPSR
ncbi:DMT family transporter [Ramlibacter humi]|uniref:EamA family transporter n=1 Tax=Ramlibacter humi TaxID=2530451 RepID=A0A4Z0CBN5_9BURK|nr:EamA family transporter [Ramlibacter humi]TFZ08761.1 EamA family transporter [Ramlibacter humi]